MRPVHLVAIAALALGGPGCARSPAPSAPAATAAPVRAAPVESAAVAAEVRAVGVLTPRDEVRLAFKVGGVIERIDVDAGDRVRRGQTLATLKRGEVDASVAQATEAVAKAKRDLERAERLRADEVATEEQVQDLTTAYNVARANLDAVRFNARFARIEAPADGIVLEKLAEGDELVQGGQPVLVLGATSSGWVVRVSLADRDVVRVQPGGTATVSFDAFPGRVFRGTVTRIAAAADPVTGTFEVQVEVDPNGARFVRGLVAKVVLGLADARAAAGLSTVVPLTALVDANGDSGTVYVVDTQHGIARRRVISVGPMIGDQVVVSAGLQPGEQVVTEGAAWLTDGSAVRVVPDRG